MSLNQEKVASISAIELDVLHQIALQKNTQQISASLRIPPRLVNQHISNMIVKFGQRTIVGLVIFAMANEMISGEVIDRVCNCPSVPHLLEKARLPIN